MFEPIDFTSPAAPQNFASSLRRFGFAVFRRHPIPAALVQATSRAWANFFMSPTKPEYLFDPGRQDGWFPQPDSNSPESFDPKEFFHLFPWGRMPPSAGHLGLRLRTEALHVGYQLLSWLQEDMPDNNGARQRTLCEVLDDGVDNTLLRILRYAPGDFADGVSGSGAHRDSNLLTILVSPSEPGLEVRHSGNWVPIPSHPDLLVVNAGKMLEYLSGKRYPSVLHRVVLQSDHERIALPVFLHPAGDEAINGSETAKEMLQRRTGDV